MAEGRAEGQAEGRAGLLRDLVVARFGESEDATRAASALATLTPPEAVARIEQAASIDDLIAAT